MLVRDRMTSNPVTVPQATTLQDALTLIRSRHFRHLPIVEPDGELVGIVTEKDLVLAVPSPTHSLSVYEANYFLSQMTVAQVMKRKVITVSPDLPIEEAARIMIDHRIGCLPVVEHGQLIGIISDTDIFRVFVEGLGGGHPSLRLTVVVPEEVGSLARVTSAVAELNANIHSLGTFWGDQAGDSVVAFRLEGISRQDVVQALEAKGIRVAGVWELEPA
mgnify:CR=1 FL=1